MLSFGSSRVSRLGLQAARRARSARGQSLVEFSLILPILLVLLLGIADLGRVFAAGIAMQAAGRDGAEAGAQTYTQIYGEPAMTSTSLYGATDQRALSVACSELANVPGVQLDPTVGCTIPAINGRMPAVAACVHDSSYTLPDGANQPGDTCGMAPPSDPTDAAFFAQSCPNLLTPGNGGTWSTALDPNGLPFVEVRICYRFDMLTNVPAFFHVGPVFLRQSSNFVVAAY